MTLISDVSAHPSSAPAGSSCDAITASAESDLPELAPGSSFIRTDHDSMSFNRNWQVKERHAQQPNRPITAIFAEVYGEETTLSA
ncbi:hypothetical protein [Vreelandella sulfidaeris]|uniref:hypothetical protein n=1 Tax=Vreelandella sulfidaeris TaxID=115553 RepID=UPI0035E8B81D